MPPSSRIAVIAVLGTLLLLTLGVFAQVRHHDFVNFDDYLYVTRNPNFAGGLTVENTVRAFRPHAAYWIPLTWLSLLVDYELYGNDATGFLLTNVAFHAANAILVFLLFLRTTGATWRSAFVAAVFAVHPLHVESVAWVTERKDVLSTCLLLLAAHGWVWRCARPRSAGRYAACAAAFALALLAKPAVATFPVLLLLLDVWPLQRVRPAPGRRLLPATRDAWRLVAEKLPLFAMSLGAGLVLLRTQAAMGGMEIARRVTPLAGLRHALEGYAAYLADTVWPAGLAALYPVASGPARWWPSVGAALLLAAITAVAVEAARRGRTYALVGWLWFLLLLLPASGIVPVGVQVRADRFTYVPSIGLTVAVAWSAVDLLGRRRLARIGLTVAALAAVAALSVAAHRQTGFWRDTETLFLRALEVTEDNSYAHNRLAEDFKSRLEFAAAEPHYVAAIRIAPWFWKPQLELARILGAQGRTAEAAPIRAAGERVRAGATRPAETVGVGWMQAGRWDDAAALLRRAVREDPRSIVARASLARCLAELGRHAEARDQLEAALAIDPDHPTLLRNLAGLLATAPGETADPERALGLADRGLFIAGRLEAGLLEAAADAHAAAGRADEARRVAGRALELARARGDAETAAHRATDALNRGARDALVRRRVGRIVCT